MSELHLKNTILMVAIIALSSCDEVSTPISPVESKSEYPTEVVNLTATIVDESKISLTWEDEARNERGFEIFERSGSEGEFIPLMRTEANVTAVLLDKHRRKFDFHYKVRAINGNGVTGFSNVARVVGFQRAVIVQGKGKISRIAFSPDGSQIAAVGYWSSPDNPEIYGDCVIADASNGEIIHLIDSPNEEFGRSLSYHPNGREIAIGTELCNIEYWDTRTGEFLYADSRMQYVEDWFLPDPEIYDLEFSPNGRYLAVIGGRNRGALAILKTSSPDLPFKKMRIGRIYDMEFSPDSEILAVMAGYELRLYRTADSHIVGKYMLEANGPPSVSFHPNGEILAVCNGIETILMDYRSLEIQKRIPVKGDNIAYSFDGNYIASINNHISFWNPGSGIEVFTLNSSSGNLTGAPILGYQISPSNNSVAILNDVRYLYNDAIVDPFRGDIPSAPIEIWY